MFKFSSLRFSVVLAPFLALVVYLYASNPQEIVLTSQGEIVGLFNEAREKLQGSRFWTNQLYEAKRALELRRTAPQRDAARQARLDALDKKLTQRAEERYKQYPNTRPSEAEQRADALRTQADEIEWAEFEKDMEKLRLKRMLELEAIIQVIESRTP